MMCEKYLDLNYCLVHAVVHTAKMCHGEYN